MMLAFALHVESYPLLALALAVAVVAALLAWRRRVGLPRLALALLGLGLLALALAAGGVSWDRPKAGEVLVMVDLSPSTRGARYRDMAALDRRIAQLLDQTPYRIVHFAEKTRDGGAKANGDTGSLPDLPGDRTAFEPPPAGAVLLFSDGRFELPAAGPRVFVVVDPMLEETADATVERLEVRGDLAAARMRNQAAEARDVVVADQRQAVGHGSVVVMRSVRPQQAISARVQGQDLWPENDALSVRIPPPIASERWWVGGDAPVGWRPFTSAELPVEAEAYLGTSVIVLHNIPADALSPAQQQRLEQYVRDLGGGVAIFGGERAFAAGAYPGSRLEAISPLSSTPPAPAVHWVLLADSSGSMAEPVGPTTRWDLARRALLGLMGRLPPDDAVTVGSFAQEVRWWSRGRSARETAGLPLPPPDIRPHGPTNLETALQSIIASADGGLRMELLILSDADADILDPAAIAQGFAQRKIRLHLLDTYGQGRGLPILGELAQRSGGQIVRELDPGKWLSAARHLAAQAADDHLQHAPAEVRFGDEKGDRTLFLPARSVSLWNRVWLKDRATSLAETGSGDERIALAARWQQGLGRVAAVAFSPTAAEAEAIARLVEQQPGDPRLRIAWDAGSKLRVEVDAVEGQAHLNDLPLELELAEEGGALRRIAIPQVGPGRYALAIESPRRPAIASVWHDGRVIDRTAVAGRYPPEFDAIGNDRAAMQRLAALTGGRVIEPGFRKPIDFAWPRQSVPLTAWLAAAGFALVAGGLLWWRFV